MNRIGLGTVAGDLLGYGPSRRKLEQPLHSGARPVPDAHASLGATLPTSEAVARLAPR